MSGAPTGLSRRAWLAGAAALVWLGCREKLEGDAEPVVALEPHNLDLYAAGPQHFADLGSEGCIFELHPGAHTLAAACARALPGEVTVEALSQALFAAPVPPAAATGLPKVGAAIRADFEAGRTLVVDGWVLSPTEVQLCALAFLQGCRSRPLAPNLKNLLAAPPSAGGSEAAAP